ncbi:hypothetical protein B5P41_04625 [Bacillus sp. SRB_28]|nr:hypothetical protein B5P41_04625 [Bacillus sp. SRB_28]
MKGHINMLTQTEKLEQIAEKKRLVSKLSSIALNLLEDDMYTKEYAASKSQLVEIINQEIDLCYKA